MILIIINNIKKFIVQFTSKFYIRLVTRLVENSEDIEYLDLLRKELDEFNFSIAVKINNKKRMLMRPSGGRGEKRRNFST